MFGNIFDKAFDAVESFADDPIGSAVSIVTQPVRDGLDVIDGLTVGELRVKAAIRLGADVAVGMAVSELVEWYEDNNNV